MIDGKTVLAVIPARGGSKGLPGKNIRPLCGKPLIGWPITAARQSRYVDRLVVSTDCEGIAAVAREYGADVPFMRPEHLARDESPTMPVLEHAIAWFEEQAETFDYVILLEATSPLTDSHDIDRALEMLTSSPLADSIIGVAHVDVAHPAFCTSIGSEGLLKPFIGADFGNMPRRQDVEPLYFFDGTLYISSIAGLKKYRSFCHQRTLPYVVPKWKSFDVDCLTDFICIEAIMQRRDELPAVTAS